MITKPNYDEKFISILILIFVFIGCLSSSNLNKETIQQDTINFTKKERKLINDYINEKGFVKWDTIYNDWTDTIYIDWTSLVSLTYEDVINDQLKTELRRKNQKLRDSLNVLTLDQNRLIYHKDRDPTNTDIKDGKIVLYQFYTSIGENPYQQSVRGDLLTSDMIDILETVGNLIVFDNILYMDSGKLLMLEDLLQKTDTGFYKPEN